MAEENFNFIPTRCSAIKNTAVQYQEVIYKDPVKRKRESRLEHAPSLENKMLPVETQEIDMKRARYEILKFARRNAMTTTKQQTDRELAIKLGARAPRNRKCLNYKEILFRRQKNKMKKEKKVELKKINERFNGKLLKTKKKKSKKKTKTSVLDVYGKATKKMLKENNVN